MPKLPIGEKTQEAEAKPWSLLWSGLPLLKDGSVKPVVGLVIDDRWRSPGRRAVAAIHRAHWRWIVRRDRRVVARRQRGRRSNHQHIIATLRTHGLAYIFDADRRKRFSSLERRYKQTVAKMARRPGSEKSVEKAVVWVQDERTQKAKLLNRYQRLVRATGYTGKTDQPLVGNRYERLALSLIHLRMRMRQIVSVELHERPNTVRIG